MADDQTDPLAPYLYSGGAAPAASGDPLDAQVAAQAKAAAAASMMQPGSPDQAGQGNQLGRAFGIPADTAERQAPSLIATQQARQASALIDQHPAIGGWLSDPRNAAVAKDDLGKVGQTARAVAGAHAALQQPTAPAPTLWNSLKGIWSSTGSSLAMAAAGINEGLADWLPDSVRRFGEMDTAAQYAQQFTQAKADMAAARPAFKSWTAGKAYDITSGVAEAVPTMAATLFAGPEVGVPLAIAQFGGGGYGKYRARGATRGQAALGGTLEGATAAIGEVLPLGYLTSKLTSTGARPFIAGFLARDVGSIEAQIVANKIIDTAIANPNKTWREAASELPSEMGDGLLTAGMMGSIAAGAHVVANRLAPAEQAGFQAADQAHAVDQLMIAAASSKVRARDNVAYSNLIAGLTRDTPLENVYVPLSLPSEYFAAAEDWIT